MICCLCLDYMGCVGVGGILSQGPSGGKISYQETLFLNWLQLPWEEPLFGLFCYKEQHPCSLAQISGMGCLVSCLLQPGPEGTGQGDLGGWGVVSPGPGVAQLQVAPPSTCNHLCLEWGHLTEANRSTASPQALWDILKNVYFLVWLHQVLAVAHGLSSYVTWAQQVQRKGLVTPWHVGPQFPDRGSTPCPLHRKVDS